MENANKALIMAGGILITLMLVTLFSVFISTISSWPETQNEIKNAEQIAEFNAEYEVYQKSAMYGVDVISCLNKAISNNKKNEEGATFLGGLGYAQNYEVNVSVKLTKPLSETISITAVQYNSFISGYREGVIYDSNKVVENKLRTDLKLKDVFDIDESKQLTSFKKNDFLKYEMTKEESGFEINKTYQLVDNSVSDANNILIKILGHSNSPRQTVKNTETSPNYVYDPSATPPSYGWSTATWSTYLYSFKQKRFKCTNLEYSEKTGLVNKLEFIEI